MPIPGSLGTSLLYNFAGSPSGVSTSIFDAPLGSIILNTATGGIPYIKTVAAGTNTVDQLVSLTGTQTLTNKTLTAPTITGATIGGTLSTIIGSVQALAAAGAVNLTTAITTIASAGAIAITLADGANGQIKVISMITDGGDATLTVANLQGGTTIVFGDIGDTATLVFLGTKWAAIGLTGVTIA